MSGNQSLYAEANIIRQNGSDLQIIFPQEVNTISIEFVLRAGLIKSYKNESKTTFNFKYCTWIDPFALNLIALWIRDLLNKKIGLLSIDSPNNVQVKYFMQSSGFFSYISRPTEEQPTRPSDIQYAISQYSPLRLFDTEKQFKEYLTYLKDDEVLNKIFFDVNNEELIKKGKIRDVILAELGDNIFTHAKSDLGNVLMSKDKPKNKVSAVAWKRNLIAKSSVLEKRFFTDIPEDGIILITIADNGVGITKTLKEAYKLDTKKDDGNFTNCDVLEYAFDKFSSSRSTSTRIAGTEKLTLDEAEINYNEIYKPTTGLFKLYSLVQNLNGFIYVRSADSALSINFLSDVKPIVERSDSKTFQKLVFNKLSNFRGTQFKIIIPDVPGTRRKISRSSFNFPETKRSLDWKLLSLHEYLDIFNGSDKTTQIKRLNELVLDIRAAFNERSSAGIIFDISIVKDQAISNPKYLQYIVAILMVSQHENFVNVVIGIPSSLEDILQDSFNNREGYEYIPLVYFTLDFERGFLGVSDSQDQNLKTLFNNEKLDSKHEEQLLLVNKFASLFVRSNGGVNQEYSLIHNRATIFETLRSYYKALLIDFIDDQTNLVFNREAKVLLPSKVYCKGFYEVANLISNSFSKTILREWIECIILLTKPTWLFSLNIYCNQIIEEVLNSHRKTTFKGIGHIKITEPLALDYVDLIKASQEINDNEKIIVFTDVIGTTKSIVNLLRTIVHKNVTNVYAIINASKQNNEKFDIGMKQIPINEVYKASIEFYDSKPSNWLYHEIYFVDKKTNKLGGSILKHNEPLWSPVSNRDEVFETILLDNNLIYRANKQTYDGIYFTHWFDFENLFRLHRVDFAQTILENLKAYNESENQTIDVENAILLHIREKPYLDEIITSILGNSNFKFVPNSISLDVFYFRYLDPPMKLKDRVLIFIDDAFTGEDSLYKLLDYCTRNNVFAIFIYYIVKSGDSGDFDRLKNIRIFGTTKVFIEYLIDVQLPVYRYENPFESILDDLEYVLSYIPRKIDFKGIRDFITAKVKEYEFEQPYTSSTQKKLTTTERELILRSVDIFKSYYSLEKFEKIISALNAADENQLPTLTYLRVLSEEFLPDLLSLNESQLLKDDLKVAILKSIDYFISTQKLDTLSKENFSALLGLIRFYDPESLFDYYKEIFDQIKLNENKLHALVVYLITLILDADLEIPSINKSLTELSISLRDFPNRAIGNHLIDLIQEGIHYQSHIENQTNVANDIITIKQEFHSLNRAIDLFDTALNTRYYIHLNQHIEDLALSLKNIKRAISSIARKSFRYDDYNSELKSRIKLLDQFISQLDDLSEGNPNYEHHIDELTMLSNQISYYFKSHEKRNFQQVLNSLVQEIVPIINNRINNFFYSFFITKGVETLPPKIAQHKVYVFAEKEGFLKIIDNIINNILIHSGATKFFYELLIDESHVVISFYDNGISIEHAMSAVKPYKNKGLGILEELVSLYDGELSYKETSSFIYSCSLNNLTQLRLRLLDFDK